MKTFSVKTIFILLFAAFVLCSILPGNGQINNIPGQNCSNEGELCDADSDCCGNDLICKIGVCVPNCVDKPCTSSLECCPSDACINGLCKKCHGEGEACSSGLECCSQLRCNGGTCSPCKELGGSCAVPADCCGSGFGDVICKDGKCTECASEGGSCPSGSECCSDLLCNNKKKCVTCFDGTGLEQCSSDAQCCGELKCINNYCQKCSEEGEECINDSFCCDPNHECAGSITGPLKCVACKGKGESCSGLFTSGCCDGLDCIGGYCDDCSRLGESCEEVRCCLEEDLKCAPNQVCIECAGFNGQCQAASECCNPDNKCLGGRCVACSTFDGACNSDSDCCNNLNLKCINGKCASQTGTSGSNGL